jgi:hypothetical protein
MLASDLQGLGVNPLQAQRTANAGIGPLTITAAGTAFASATRVGGSQYLVSCSNATASNGISLPPVGGDNGALIGDVFTINNATGTSTLNIFCSTGVTISVANSNTSSTTIAVHTTMTCYPVTTTQWAGIKGS